MLKEQRMASSQKIHKGRCFTLIKGQRDSCLLSELNLPVLYIPWKNFGAKSVAKFYETETNLYSAR